MKRLLTALLVTFIIASCSSPTTPDTSEPEFEPYTVGSFKMIAPDKAEYIGLQGNQSTALAKIASESDTTIITDPIGYGFKLWDDSTFYSEEAVAFSFLDSIDTHHDYNHVDVHWKGYARATLSVKVFEWETHPIKINGYFGTPCDFAVGESIKFEYYTTNSSFGETPVKVIIVKTEGMAEVGKDILGCS